MAPDTITAKAVDNNFKYRKLYFFVILIFFISFNHFLIEV